MINMSNNNNNKQGTDIHYNEKGQAVNTATRTDGVKDLSSPTGTDKSEKKNESNKSSSSSSHKSESHSHSHGGHAKLGGGKHSFVHPDEESKPQEDEQKVKCDCGEFVPVSKINKTSNSDVAVIGQQSQNVGTANKAGLTVDTRTNPPTVIEDGVKSTANLYAHDARVNEVLGKNTEQINQANSSIELDQEARENSKHTKKEKK